LPSVGNIVWGTGGDYASGSESPFALCKTIARVVGPRRVSLASGKRGIQPQSADFIYAAYIAAASLRSRIYTQGGSILRSRSIDLHQTAARGDADSGEHFMLDTILLAAGIVGLLLTVAYAHGCERM